MITGVYNTFIMIDKTKVHWISVKDKLPNDGEKVLIYGTFDSHNYKVDAAYYFSKRQLNDGWYESFSDFWCSDPIAQPNEVEYWAYYPEFNAEYF